MPQLTQCLVDGAAKRRRDGYDGVAFGDVQRKVDADILADAYLHAVPKLIDALEHIWQMRDNQGAGMDIPDEYDAFDDWAGDLAEDAVNNLFRIHTIEFRARKKK